MVSDGVGKAYLHIHQFRVKQNRSDEKKATIMFNLSPAMPAQGSCALVRAVMEVLIIQGAVVQCGGPPPSPAERKLKLKIAEMKKKEGAK